MAPSAGKSPNGVKNLAAPIKEEGDVGSKTFDYVYKPFATAGWVL